MTPKPPYRGNCKVGPTALKVLLWGNTEADVSGRRAIAREKRIGYNTRMSRIQEIVFLVFGPMSVGGAFLLSLPVLRTAGLAFFRTNGMVFWIIVVTALTLVPVSFIKNTDFSLMLSLGAFGIFTLLFGVYNLRLWFRNAHHSNLLLYAATAFGVLAVTASAWHYLPVGAGALRLLLVCLSLLVSGALLGAGALGMLLGHRYLTHPSLSIVPLRVLVTIFMVLIGIEALFTGMSLVVPSPRLTHALQLRTFEGLYLWIRLLIGIVGPIVLAPMILQTVKERATMSATGLLYIAMMMVVIGAIFSRFFLLVDMGVI